MTVVDLALAMRNKGVCYYDSKKCHVTGFYMEDGSGRNYNVSIVYLDSLRTDTVFFKEFDRQNNKWELNW